MVVTGKDSLIMQDLIDELRAEILDDVKDEESFKELIQEAMGYLSSSTYVGLLLMKSKLSDIRAFDSENYSRLHHACHAAVNTMVIEEHKNRKTK